MARSFSLSERKAWLTSASSLWSEPTLSFPEGYLANPSQRLVLPSLPVPRVSGKIPESCKQGPAWTCAGPPGPGEPRVLPLLLPHLLGSGFAPSRPSTASKQEGRYGGELDHALALGMKPGPPALCRHIRWNPALSSMPYVTHHTWVSIGGLCTGRNVPFSMPTGHPCPSRA